MTLVLPPANVPCRVCVPVEDTILSNEAPVTPLLGLVPLVSFVQPFVPAKEVAPADDSVAPKRYSLAWVVAGVATLVKGLLRPVPASAVC